MALLVKKFGGTSVGSINKIKSIAKNISKSKDAGHDIVVVVSAMGPVSYTHLTLPTNREV